VTTLVTGCAGFIGSHLAERLVKDGYQVIGIDCFTDYYPRKIKEANIEWLRQQPNFTFYEANLLSFDFNSITQLHDDSVTIFHLAAQAGVRSSWGKDFKVYTENNVLATQRLLEAAKEMKLEKFIYASSSSIYGDAEIYPTPEDAIPRPISPYGVTKLAGEHLCRLYWKNYGVPIVILRYFTVYGPRQRPDMAFHKFIKAILKGEEIVVYGDGNQTRDFTYVDDVVEANILAMKAEGIIGEVFNVGGGSRISINEVINLLRSITGLKVKVRYIEQQKGDVKHTGADISRTKSLLNYHPQFPVDKGIKCEYDWLSS